MLFCANRFFRLLIVSGHLIVLHYLWCRGANPYQYIVYLINNVNDPVGGCDVTGHKVSALEGQVLEKRGERGFAFTLWRWSFPSSSSCGFPHLPKCLPRAAPRHRSHQRLGYPQGIMHGGGDFRTLCCSLCADWQSPGLACPRVVTWGRWTCPHHRAG